MFFFSTKYYEYKGKSIYFLGVQNDSQDKNDNQGRLHLKKKKNHFDYASGCGKVLDSFGLRN